MQNKEKTQNNRAESRTARLRRIGLSAAVLILSAAAFSGCAAGASRDSGAYEKGIAALKDGDLDSAMIQFRTAVDQESRVAEAYRGEGLVYLKQKEYSSAATVFERSLSALRRSARSSESFEEDIEYYLAEAYMEAGDLEKALAYYAELTGGLNPDRAFLLHGVASLRNGDVEGAMDDFDRVVEQNPSYENCLRIYETLASASRKADGSAYLEKALSADPETAEEYYNRGLIYYELGNSDEALKSLKKAVDEDYTEAFSMYASVCIETGKTDQARKMFNSRISDKKELAASYNGLALCDLADEKYDDALNNLESGLKQDDDTVTEELKFNEVVVYERMLDFDTAKTKLSAFLEEYPDNEAAIRENKFLQTR
jgi:tetratricopeptide (TPR) repeat protein